MLKYNNIIIFTWSVECLLGITIYSDVYMLDVFKYLKIDVFIVDVLGGTLIG